MIQYAIDSVFLAVNDLELACRPYERLGLKLSPARNSHRTLLVGGSANLFAVHFLADTALDGRLARPIREASAAGRPLFAIALRVGDLQATLEHLNASDIQVARFRDGATDLAWLSAHDRAGSDLVLVQQIHSVQERHAEAMQAGLLGHSFPLRRLDHLAAVAHQLEERSRFWTEMLGVPLAGEVVTPALVIRQLRLGDAMFELLGPASPDSPIAKRPPGLVSMASWEVGDLQTAVDQARANGFTVTDPVPGVLPGTRIATIQGTDLAGVNMQFLTYA